MDNEISAMKEELMRLIWYMRGAISYSEICAMSSKDRDLIAKIVKDNLETTKKSGMPFF
jgi:hypothetical protein